MHVKAVHNQQKGFQCRQCSYATAHGSTLKAQINAVHNKEDMLCERCSYSTARHFSLKRHVKAKHDQEKIVDVINVLILQHKMGASKDM